MVDGSDSACALLGMEGFVVLAQREVDGEIWMAVKMTGSPGLSGDRALRS